YLRNFYELGRANLSSGKISEFGLGQRVGYVIPAGQGRDENLAKMIGALLEQGVELYRLDRELHGVVGEESIILHLRDTTAPNLMFSRRPMEEIPAGSYIIFLNQPYRQNVLALFEPQAYPDRTTATGEAERPYDVAGWTLPMTMGVDGLAVLSIREPANERKLTLIKDENDVRRDLALHLWTIDKSPIANPVKPGIRVGIYQNSNAGNMDEGW